MSEQRKIRVVVAKPGLDGHDRGAKVVARALRDAGMEVIYTGLHQTPRQIVETVIQEDPDVLCLSILSGAHNAIFPRIMELMGENEIDDVLILAGGVIPEADRAELKDLGLEGFHGPGTPLKEIVDYIRNHLKR
ncbi:methylmalonyl-CoA mutase [Candidatus Bathyarchaeota archaeon]|nr:methylmalonyl-CoA mutase [Candidatus Bathyarchaeota archaeon]